MEGRVGFWAFFKGGKMDFSQILETYSEYKRLKENLDKTPVSVAGLVDSAQAQFIYALSVKKRALAVACTDLEAKALYSDLKFFDEKVLYFPTKDYIFYNVDAAERAEERTRLAVLEKLSHGEDITVVTSAEALLSYTIPPEMFHKNTVKISLGEELEPEIFSDMLIGMGYMRVDMVEGIGQFSVRGGIIDVFSPNMDNPARIELFDVEIDSIREFDCMTQRSLDNLEACVIIPCKEAMLTADAAEKLIKYLEAEQKKYARKKGDYSKITATLGADIEELQETGKLTAIDRYISVVYEGVPTIADYINAEDFVFLIEPKRIAERVKVLSWEEGEQLAALGENGILASNKFGFYGDYKKIKEQFSSAKLVSVNALSHSGIDYSYGAIFNFAARSTVNFHGKVEYLYEDLERWSKEKYTAVILTTSAVKGENLAGSIREKGIACKFQSDKKDFEEGGVTVLEGELKKGFEYPEMKFVVISDREIFNAKKSRTRRKDKNTERLKSYTDINPGDYVVHRSHGIGRYEGIEKMLINGITKDYLKIQYNGTDCLYVPVEQMDSLYKYIGSTEKKVKVNSLNSGEWTKTKAKVKKATDEMAKQLVELYAARQSGKGYAFSEDSPWQREFEDTFLYTETEDQLRSIEEVKRDMESQKPMDRLLCGDVGYGKTEVAIRAAFKAVTDSKQVAYLCPTTILAMQHFETFLKRMENFPIKVEMLSRFRTKKQQEEILKRLKKGEIDIIIGTHRMIQKDVEFSNLGLLIIDEEQRFGVAAKERLKELKKDIDVLSMTATPIPRTLHMSMINVRDMSILEEPPENRYPVRTLVMEHDDAVICDAIRRELARGGQVFYLYNRVRGISRIAENIKRAIPDANVRVGHGKMSEDELEEIMYDMVEGRCDVLVCTTIIETGLDIPNANTIIIENADRMGLAQLYQLRGRVGRSNRNAYAYLTYRRDESLSEVAEKRLKAISEFTEFGSGFKIAMRDLEIRGAGNILGAEQHGHMDSVGYDMYCKILKASIDQLQGKQEITRETTLIDVEIDAYIPEKYIKNATLRIDIYKKISQIGSESEQREMIDELIDRFGEPPKSVMNLVEIALIKAEATELGLSEISAKGELIRLIFEKEYFAPELVLPLLKEFPREVSLSPRSERPIVIYKPKAGKKMLDNIKFILHRLFSLKNEQL